MTQKELLFPWKRESRGRGWDADNVLQPVLLGVLSHGSQARLSGPLPLQICCGRDDLFREFSYVLFHCLEISGERPHNDLMHAGILETL